MSRVCKLLILPGDGIGPEVMFQTMKVLHWISEHRGLKVEIAEDLVGGASLAMHGVPIRNEVVVSAKEADAVLFGSVGDPAWTKVPYEKRPEMAILRLRKELGLFANLRPARLYEPLIESSALKPDVVRGLDILIVRETISGIYFGEPRGIETFADGSQRAVNTEIYTTAEIERVARVAFELARSRKNRVCSVEKSNVMESGVLWRQVVTELHQRSYQDVELSHMLADNCAMQLVRDPCQFDVIVTSNLFGDILSDQASMLTGSLGMLPSATLGVYQETGKRAALYEPIHGSAPDIAGKGIANPLAQILSLALLMRYSLNRPEDGALIETAVSNVLSTGLRTADIMSTGMARVGTEMMGQAVLREIGKLA